VLGHEDSADEESFSWGLLEYPQYTRPAEWEGMLVPDVLVSGDHGRVARWRREQAILRTARLRPDLLSTADLTPEERALASEALAGGGDELEGTSE
jgi:tRNA (guanine37-N1)-methyltransferase